MEITIVVNKENPNGTITGFYSTRDQITWIKDGRSKPYNEIPTSPDEEVPLCNIFVMVDGELQSYYPLWIYPNFAKIRNEKLKLIGI